MAEMRGDLVDAKNAEVVAWGELDSVQAENERLQVRVAELNECLTKASEMVEGQGFYGPVVRRFKAALRANDADKTGGVQ